MRAQTFLAVGLLLVLQASAQEGTFSSAVFDESVLNYHPVQRDGVTDASYAKGLKILEETRSAAKNSPANLNAADYWNITTAFVSLGEHAGDVRMAFSKATQKDPGTICSYLKVLGPGKLESIIPETVMPFYADCLAASSTEKFDLEAYIATNHLNATLVRKVLEIENADQKYRLLKPVDWSKQKPLDEQNQQAVLALYEQYGTYIGRKLVGQRFENVMWAVIQHSNLPMMQRFLPIIQKAVAEKQLPIGPMKMLIDRVYAIQTHTQIFGSQENTRLAAASVQTAVKVQYGLD
jgi:hypothetical protein